MLILDTLNLLDSFPHVVTILLVQWSERELHPQKPSLHASTSNGMGCRKTVERHCRPQWSYWKLQQTLLGILNCSGWSTQVVVCLLTYGACYHKSCNVSSAVPGDTPVNFMC